jgi:PKD domain
MGKIVFVLALVFYCCACDKPSAISLTAPITPTVPAAPMAVLTFAIEGEAARPVQSLSRVHFDGSASTGDGLQYRLDFDDGSIATTSVAEHIYDRGRWTFHPRLTVSDQLGRTDTASVGIVVTSIVGIWINSLPLSLEINEQDGRTFVGNLYENFTPIAITGQLSAPRNLTFRSLDGRRSFSGAWPQTGLDSFGTEFTVVAAGGPSGGQTIRFALAEQNVRPSTEKVEIR